ncbi:MAG TPA: DUF4142 domain-containing protein [Pseudomonas xinjiangensis]|uniref:DUF4142 domain-containing protein n=2 Tax=root TaxID=1 RepID=A0A7V1FRD2_9GAMM|nr:DUF4142 domain-containing protein [Halopseudomonas xinjiangensis]HEC48012.1 DUF4142 domain-containing protein [Halopseudomonas xinjiangensis]
MTTAHIVKNGLLAAVLGLTAATAWGQSMDAAEFVDEATAKGIAEIETSKLAIEKSDNTEITSFAEKMIDEHTKANEKMRDLAMEKNLEVSDDATLMDQGKAMILQLRDGEDFNEAYTNNQVVAHEQTIELFETASENVDDEEVRKLAEEMLPKLREHLAKAQELQAMTEAQQ